MNMPNLIICLSLFLFTNNTESSPMEKLSFFEGNYRVTSTEIQRDGSYITRKAFTSGRFIHNGNALIDEYIMKNDQGEITFRGMSIRSFNPRKKSYQIVWLMPGHNGLTDLTAIWKDGKWIGKGEGYDDSGSFLERFTYSEITDNSYTFRMDRSYNNGKNWIEDFNVMRAVRM